MIKKTLLSSFIEKYYLAGRTETAKISIMNNEMICSFQGGDSSMNVLGTIKLNDIDLPNGDLNLFESTTKLLKLFTALDEEIDVKYIEFNGDIKNIELTDDIKTINFTLADSTLLSEPKKMVKKINYELEFEVNDSFITEYLRSKSALSEATEVAICVNKNKDGIDLVINYSANNVNNIVIPLTVAQYTAIDTLIFDANIIRDILTANKNIPGKIEVYGGGMLKLSFDNSTFTNEYYLLGKKV